MRFLPAAVEVVEGSGPGSKDRRKVLRSPVPLGPYPRALGEHLVRWATETPTRPFLAERSGGGFRRVTYAETLSTVRGLGQAILDRGGSPERPVMILGDNSIDHALVALAAMHVGVPAAPISVAYSLQSRDHGKLRDVASQLGPAMVHAPDLPAFAPALAALGDVQRIRVADACAPSDAVERAFSALTHDSIAKVLFTSGSTGTPKGIVNTHRMLLSNQQAIAQCWPFLEDKPPVVLDWLPWSHTFGGNHNFNMVLRNGGTLYVDPGKPAPGLIEKTVESFRMISPTLWFNVPRGFDVILPDLENDLSLAECVFRELDLLFYAAAALPPSTWARLAAVMKRVRPDGVAMTSAWGLTETSPLVTSVHFPIDRAGVIGLPAPGCELALVPDPASKKLEMRVKGPMVTPGLWKTGGAIEPRPLDEEGFFPTGDAGRLEDPNDPSRGVVFDGRTAENFKLTSGTWVLVGALRVAVIAACAPMIADAVVAGHDRDEIGLLVFPSPTCDRDALIAGLRAWNEQNPASSTRIARFLILDEPPNIDAGEITDKGYLNQRAVLNRRSAKVESLYADPGCRM
ncbi:MAG: feruloyl-CoA synthase [Polyangiales bacterium]